MRRDDEHYGNAIPVSLSSTSAGRSSYRADHRLPGECAAIEVNIETNPGRSTSTRIRLGWRERFVQAQLTSAEWRSAIAGDTPLILPGDFNICAIRDHIAHLTAICAMCANSYKRRDPLHLPDAISGADCRSYFRERGDSTTELNVHHLSRDCPIIFRLWPNCGFALTVASNSQPTLCSKFAQPHKSDFRFGVELHTSVSESHKREEA
jgi:hypothetical protein